MKRKYENSVLGFISVVMESQGEKSGVGHFFVLSGCN
jgi:hypothetical protein